MKPILYSIYKLVLPDGECYIGSTNDIQQRLRRHKSDCNNENSRSFERKLYKYIRDNSMSWDDITHEVLGTTDEFRFQLEQWHLDQNSPETVLNEINAYTAPKQYRKEYYGERINCEICKLEMNKSSLKKHKRKH